MMTFEQTGKVFTATNSIKPVIINKNHAGQYMLFTPEGRLFYVGSQGYQNRAGTWVAL